MTGTPTTNLQGLSFGGRSSAENKGKSAFDNHEPTTDNDVSGDAPSLRVWSKDAADDLQKLGNILVHFLGVPQFAEAPKLFKKQVKAPLLDKQGPRPGSIEVLAQVMSAYMLRHRVEDVERDVTLPKLQKQIVRLDMERYAIKSYNALQAVITINAVQTQRKDAVRSESS